MPTDAIKLAELRGRLLYRWRSSYLLRAFWIAFATAFLFFIPFILFDNGYFLFYGDFNVQQVPFYQMCHDAVRSGNLGWSWTTDLGANFIGSYTFYLLGSPFFWLTIPFPSEAVPYLMGPLLILKFACASATGAHYIRRYVTRGDAAVLGGLLYAFSGFSVYNIFSTISTRRLSFSRSCSGRSMNTSRRGGAACSPSPCFCAALSIIISSSVR